MSKNRENVTWQSQDGTWNLGHFTVIPGNTFDEDYDDEWDVDYDFSTFWWVSTGHPSPTAANNAWRGTNPGGGTQIAHTAETAKDCATYDAMAAATKQAETARLARPVRW